MQDKKLDVVDSFCYFGDTIGAGRGCEMEIKLTDNIPVCVPKTT